MISNMEQRKSIKDVLGFDDTWWIVFGVPVISFVVPLLFFRATLADGLLAYLPHWGISLTYTIAYWSSCRVVFIYFRRRFAAYHQTSKRILYTSAAVLAAYFSINWVLKSGLNYLKHPLPEGMTAFDFTVATLMILLLVSALYESVFLYDRWKKSIFEAEQLRRENAESQLEGLRNQVNPHFLFNSLNTLSYLIPEDPQRAVQFVQKLSKSYRYILEIRDKNLITLKEELDFLYAYLFLLQERFDKNLQAEVAVAEAYHSLHIVPLSLQILFENAIKHNIISAEKPLAVKIWVENHRLFMCNNRQLKHQAHPSTKVGLQNIKTRYAFFTEELVDVQETEAYFTVSLPLIKL